MAHDFRPYFRVTQPADGSPGRGIYIETKDVWYPDGHSNIILRKDDDHGLPGLNQPYANPLQRMELMSRVYELMWKRAKALEIALKELEFFLQSRFLPHGSNPQSLDAVMAFVRGPKPPA